MPVPSGRRCQYPRRTAGGTVNGITKYGPGRPPGSLDLRKVVPEVVRKRPSVLGRQRFRLLQRAARRLDQRLLARRREREVAEVRGVAVRKAERVLEEARLLRAQGGKKRG